MTAFFSVKNFERFQHYKDRSPPWIKLYNELLDDYAFGELPDASKWHLVAIWLLASRSGNKIPLDPTWVAKRINASAPVDLNILRSAGFIEFDQACSEALAERKQDAMPEREESRAETEGEERILPDKSGLPSKKFSYPEDFEAFWEAYPTDPNMPKKPAFKQWQRLSVEQRKQSGDAIPGFKRYCEQNSWYRPIYAERFLSQEKFEGYAIQPVVEIDLEAAKSAWGGRAAPLVAEIGATKFQAWFGEAEFDDGPPARIRFSKPFQRTWVAGHFGSELRRAYGEIELAAA